MPFGIYIHVPFCRVQCPYCTFFTVPRPAASEPMRRFLDAVRAEWTLRVGPRLGGGERPATLYWGGGTPSDLPPDDLLAFFAWADARLPGGLQALDEITVECNPETATPAFLDALRAFGPGVRPSLGVQSVHAADLARLGRGNTEADARQAIAGVAARFANWTADLMIGIPESSWERLAAGLETLVQAGAPHLSMYCLELPRARARKFGDPQTEASEARKADWYERASAWIEAQGYEHYEISNAARAGFRARHNSAYWNGTPYVGLGPGAHSLDCPPDGPPARRMNRPDAAAYGAALAGGADAPHTVEILSARERFTEQVLTGLRLRDGVSEALLGPACGPLLDRLEAAGLGHRAGGRFGLRPRGWMISDSIILELVTMAEAGGWVH